MTFYFVLFLSNFLENDEKDIVNDSEDKRLCESSSVFEKVAEKSETHVALAHSRRIPADWPDGELRSVFVPEDFPES